MKTMVKRGFSLFLACCIMLCSAPLSGFTAIRLPALSALFGGRAHAAEANGFTYTVLNGTYCQVTGYTGADTAVTIPEALDGYLVQSVGENAFQDNIPRPSHSTAGNAPPPLR